MPDEEDLAFEELEEPDDLADADLDELEDDDVIEDEEDDDVADVLVDDEVETDVDVDVEQDVVEEPVAAVAAVAEEDDDDEDDDDDLDPDDVEAGLDVILKDRLVVVEDEDEEEEEETPDPEERVEGATRALTKRPGEFTCQSCFLVKHPSQLADSDRMLCRDCV